MDSHSVLFTELEHGLHEKDLVLEDPPQSPSSKKREKSAAKDTLTAESGSCQKNCAAALTTGMTLSSS